MEISFVLMMTHDGTEIILKFDILFQGQEMVCCSVEWNKIETFCEYQI